MYAAQKIEVWNLTPGSQVYASAQPIFNICGRLPDWQNCRSLQYRINGSALRPVFVDRRSHGPQHCSERLEKEGEFNIDTLCTCELLPSNQIEFVLTQVNGEVQHEIIQFHSRVGKQGPIALDLRAARQVEEACQVVQGHWQIGRSAQGESCLEITHHAAGLDRIFLLGHPELQHGFRVRARLQVNAWQGLPHNCGLLFKWQPHAQGDGTSLPLPWTTGLAYYYSHSRGLRVRMGKDVRIDENGRKTGSTVLGEASLRQGAGHLAWLANKYKVLSQLASQMRLGIAYNFALDVHAKHYSFTVWQAERAQPKPQITCPAGESEHLRGAVGIIASRCAVQVFELSTEPL